jgi:hypothetical protein
MEVTTGEAVNAVNDLAAGAAQHGKDNMFTGFVLFFMIALVLVGIWILRLTMSKKYIKADKVLDFMRENHKDLLKREVKAEDLLAHAVFAQWKKVSTACEDIAIVEDDALSQSKTDLCKDYIRMRIRNIRGGMEAIIKKSGQHKDGFDAYFGGTQEFESRIFSTYSKVEDLLRHQMVTEYQVPTLAYNALKKSLSGHDELMREMVQQAAKRKENYHRLHDVLTSQFASAVNIVDGVVKIISGMDMGDFEYKQRTDTTFAEMHRVSTGDSMHLFKNVFDPDD